MFLSTTFERKKLFIPIANFNLLIKLNLSTASIHAEHFYLKCTWAKQITDFLLHKEATHKSPSFLRQVT